MNVILKVVKVEWNGKVEKSGHYMRFTCLRLSLQRW